MIRTLALGILFLAVSNPAFADSCPLLTTPYSATYFGSYKGWRIDTVQELVKRPQNEWRLSIHADNFLGSILEKSQYRVTPAGTIQSHEYSNLRKVMLNKNQQSTLFDWNKKTATTTGDRTGSVTLKGGELDNLNYQIMLRCDLLAGKTEFVYPVVDRKEVDKMEFKVVGEEVLDTRLGKLNTVVVKRIRQNSNRLTTLWLAKEKNYLMVKLLQEERKDTEAYLLYIDSVN